MNLEQKMLGYAIASRIGYSSCTSKVTLIPDALLNIVCRSSFLDFFAELLSKDLDLLTTKIFLPFELLRRQRISYFRRAKGRVQFSPDHSRFIGLCWI